MVRYVLGENANVNDIRDLYLFDEVYNPQSYKHGGIRRFDEVSPRNIEALIPIKMVDKNEFQNNSPTIGQILKFCKKHPLPNHGWYVHGYAVSFERPDCRVSLEGFGTTCPIYDEKLIAAFRKFCMFADEIICELGEPLYCWYD